MEIVFHSALIEILILKFSIHLPCDDFENENDFENDFEIEVEFENEFEKSYHYKLPV